MFNQPLAHGRVEAVGRGGTLAYSDKAELLPQDGVHVADGEGFTWGNHGREYIRWLRPVSYKHYTQFMVIEVTVNC